MTKSSARWVTWVTWGLLGLWVLSLTPLSRVAITPGHSGEISTVLLALLGIGPALKVRERL